MTEDRERQRNEDRIGDALLYLADATEQLRKAQTAAPTEDRVWTHSVWPMSERGSVTEDREPQTCWTCGAAMTAEEYRTAVREVADESKRWCINCHYRVEMSHAPLAIGNMLRFVAGLPKVGPWATAERDSAVTEDREPPT